MGNEKNFDFSSIKNFDAHIENSIKGYGELVQDIQNLSEYFVEANTNVYDVGCSSGKLVYDLAKKHTTANVIGIEKEGNFTKALENNNNALFKKMDLFDVENMTNASLITSVFTMQFIPQHKRFKAVQKVYNSMNYGAGFIFCEKMLAESSKLQDILSFMYYDHKREHFSDTEILDKEYDLRHQMKLYTLDENIQMLRDAGFRKIEIFWKRYTFTGILAIK